MSQDKQAPPLPADVDRILSTMAEAVTSLEPDDPEIRRKLAAVFGEAADRLRDTTEVFERSPGVYVGGYTGHHGFRFLARAWRDDLDMIMIDDCHGIDRPRENDLPGVDRMVMPREHAAELIAVLRKAVDQ